MSLFSMPPELKPFTSDFVYQLCDISRHSDEEIIGAVRLRVMLLILKYIFREDMRDRLPYIFGLLHELADKRTGLEYLETFATYLIRGDLHGLWIRKDYVSAGDLHGLWIRKDYVSAADLHGLQISSLIHTDEGPECNPFLPTIRVDEGGSDTFNKKSMTLKGAKNESSYRIAGQFQARYQDIVRS